jgi:hypothetical protein
MNEPEAATVVLAALADFKSGFDKLSRGPATYYIEKVRDQIDLLFERFCPFKVGDRVQIRVAPRIDKEHAPGWIGSEHFLVVGAIGTVIERDANKRGFFFQVTFDDESYIDREGKKHLILPDRRHSYNMRDFELELLAREKV